MMLKGKSIPLTDHGGPYGCKWSKMSHFLDNRLTDGLEVVRFTYRPAFASRKIPVNSVRV
jgi:hypothetical protein